MSKTVNVPTLDKCVEVFGRNDAQRIHSELLKSGFRSASSLHDQIQDFKTISPNLSIRDIANLLNISNNRYYATMKSDVLGRERKSSFSPKPAVN